jgi:hypothetical protein
MDWENLWGVFGVKKKRSWKGRNGKAQMKAGSSFRAQMPKLTHRRKKKPRNFNLNTE